MKWRYANLCHEKFNLWNEDMPTYAMKNSIYEMKICQLMPWKIQFMKWRYTNLCHEKSNLWIKIRQLMSWKIQLMNKDMPTYAVKIQLMKLNSFFVIFVQRCFKKWSIVGHPELLGLLTLYGPNSFLSFFGT